MYSRVRFRSLRAPFSSPGEMQKPKVEILNPNEYQVDPTNLTIILHEEDHTIGNSLKHILCGMKDVEFCGYNVPHPLEDKILVRLQTQKDVPALPILLEGFKQLEKVFTTIREKFDEKYESYKEKH